MKQARDTIKQLQLVDGSVNEDKNLILHKIFCFYSDLSKSNLVVIANRDKRERVIALILRTITDEENERMKVLPTE